MKNDDLKNMNKEYFKLAPVERVNPPTRVWGFEAEAARRITQQIYADIDERTLGISWWSGHSSIGPKARILISDYLYLCGVSLERNLVEARVHFMQAKHFFDKNQNQIAHLLVVNHDRSITPNHQPLPSMQEHIDDQLEDMHTVGFFRAIGTTLDCIAALIIGVGAFPNSLFKAKFSDIPQTSDQEGKGNRLKVRHALQRDLLDRYYSIVANDGWLRWTNEYRNMLVHRGRMVQMSSLSYKTLLDTEGRPLLNAQKLPRIRTKKISHLPGEPDMSEIEVMRSNFEGLYLQEDAMVTMDGVFTRAVKLVEDVCCMLEATWTSRKVDPISLQQPSAQWSETGRTSSISFSGIAPKSVPLNPKKMSVSPNQVKRMIAASLDGENIENWKTMN